jgi:hypothetical protein
MKTLRASLLLIEAHLSIGSESPSTALAFPVGITGAGRSFAPDHRLHSRLGYLRKRARVPCRFQRVRVALANARLALARAISQS